MHCCPRKKTKKKTSFRFEACLKNKKCLFFTTLFVWTDESNVELCERKTVRDKKRHSIPLSKPTYAEIEVIPKGSHFYFIILFLFFVLKYVTWSGHPNAPMTKTSVYMLTSIWYILTMCYIPISVCWMLCTFCCVQYIFVPSLFCLGWKQASRSGVEWGLTIYWAHAHMHRKDMATIHTPIQRWMPLYRLVCCFCLKRGHLIVGSCFEKKKKEAFCKVGHDIQPRVTSSFC